MATKWEYMYLEYDGSPDPDLPPVERMKEAMIGKKDVKLYFPDGSLKLVPLEMGNANHRYHILSILNQIGQARWEAFDPQSKSLKEFRVFKQELLD